LNDLGGIDADLWQQRQRRVRAGIDHDVAQWRGQHAGRWQCKSADRHAVHGPQQHDALDEVARRHQPRIGSGGGWPRIEVAGVRRNDGFGHRFGARSGCGGGEQGGDVAAQFGGGGRIKQAGNGGWADADHVFSSR